MNEDVARLNRCRAERIIAELRRMGVLCFVVSPGSRSTPLAMAVARANVSNVVHFDERGAAFFALGHARATGRPAALICTSGTAAANYYPAVIEAAMDNVPMILLTADRPPELVGTGANQTIDQTGLYGKYVMHEVDLPCPEDDSDDAQLPDRIVEAVAKAVAFDGGPVHINCRFRKPLYPEPGDSPVESVLVNSAQNQPQCDEIKTDCDAEELDSRKSKAPDIPETRDAIAELVEKIKTSREGLIVAGRLESEDESVEVVHLAMQAGWLIFPDISSGLRLGRAARMPFIGTYYDLHLSTGKMPVPEELTVLYLGGRYVSTALTSFLKRVKKLEMIHLHRRPEKTDPDGLVTKHIHTSVLDACVKLRDSMSRRKLSSWAESVFAQSRKIRGAFERTDPSTLPFGEALAINVITQMQAPEAVLFVGNSMPVRDMNTFGAPTQVSPLVAVNRGVSGIDGNLATAAGFATGHDRPVWAVVGDLTLLHDINSLALYRNLPQPSIVIVLNNGGGGIFDLLPIARHQDVIDRYFAAAHEMDFSGAATQFGLAYHSVTTAEQLVTTLSAAMKEKGPSLVEVKLDRKLSHKRREELIARVSEWLDMDWPE
ncbi:MAG TPA: 2-succinyl-5-enolpyruvyl-6-hydroxy-3-cyclohexene-1-carboxylic-acid synthase [candidate division Zixibacteria bacterium]|nr:2-succinyl-5-enolpyruvyl-6-hydroxy-3-cyclohexene-1-carboxylic-acid synthase [candidate division Zixibacteria bacterium]